MFEKNVHLARKMVKNYLSSALHFVSTGIPFDCLCVCYCTLLFSILVPELSARLYCIVQHLRMLFYAATICKLLCYLPTQAQGQFGVQTQPETRQASAFSLACQFFSFPRGPSGYKLRTLSVQLSYFQNYRGL